RCEVGRELRVRMPRLRQAGVRRLELPRVDAVPRDAHPRARTPECARCARQRQGGIARVVAPVAVPRRVTVVHARYVLVEPDAVARRLVQSENANARRGRSVGGARQSDGVVKSSGYLDLNTWPLRDTDRASNGIEVRACVRLKRRVPVADRDVPARRLDRRPTLGQLVAIEPGYRHDYCTRLTMISPS